MMRPSNVDLDFNRDSIHRPMAETFLYDNDRAAVGLSWGSKWADPVWSIYVSFPIARWPRRLRPRRWK